MLTEQEVIAVLNEKIGKNEVKEGSMRFIKKLQSIEQMVQEQVNRLQSLSDQVKAQEDLIKKTKGARSMLIELIAEEENLVSTDDQEQSEQ